MKKNCLGILLLVLCCLSGSARAEKEGGGGSIVVDGVTYDLADLHFVPLPSEGFQLDEELTGQLKSIDQALQDKNFELSISKFFERSVFDDRVEYRLVAQLPANCKFIPSENLPPGMPGIPAACTKGYITYILPREFVKLDLLKKALLIIHERIQPYAPDQEYELYTSFVHGIYIYVAKFYPAFQSQDENFILNPKELGFLNLLRKRINQLIEQSRSTLLFNERGGVFYCNNKYSETNVSCKVTGNNIRFHAGSIIKVLRGGSISGNDITIKKTRLYVTSIKISGNEFEINGLSYRYGFYYNEHVTGEMRFLRNTSLKNLTVLSLSGAVVFGSDQATTVLDGRDLDYAFLQSQITSSSDLMNYRTCLTYLECRNQCPVPRSKPAKLESKVPPVISDTATTTTGVIFTRVINHPELGESWMDPCGLIWGDLVKSPPFDKYNFTNIFHPAEDTCQSIGARLPTELEYRQLREFFGAALDSNVGYIPQILPNLAGFQFWAATYFPPTNAEENRYFFNGTTGEIRTRNIYYPGWIYMHSIRCVTR